jgi:hypothetical protein
MTHAMEETLGRAWGMLDEARRERDTAVAERDEARAEVDRLRAVIDNPGPMVSTWRPTRDQIVGIAHAQEVVITVPAGEIRDHLRVRLGVSS